MNKRGGTGRVDGEIDGVSDTEKIANMIVTRARNGRRSA